MSRNSNKIRGNQNPNYKQEEQQETAPAQSPPPAPSTPRFTKDNPFGLSFVTPTETITLPSGGKFYPENSSLFQKDSVEIRHMTAKEEDILSSGASDKGAASVFNKILSSLLVDSDINPEDFLEEDKMSILISARITGYGNSYSTKVYCQNCDDQTVHTFDLSKQQVIQPQKEVVIVGENEEQETEEEKDKIYYNPQTDTFLCTLPTSRIELEIVNISNEILENIEKEKRQKLKHNLPFNYTLCYLENIIMTANRISDPNMIRQLLQVLPAADASYLKDFYNGCYPHISTTQETKCTVCHSTSEREAPLTWALFRTDL